MKKLICFLVVVQMIIISMHGLLIFRGYALSSLINGNTSSLMLVFDTFEEYHFFLDLAEREGLTVTRPVFIDDTNLVMYTSDLSLDGRVELKSGRWPNANSNEFISVTNTNENNQVGLIYNVLPGYNISISRIENTTNVETHGMFFVNTIDLEVLENLVDELNNNIYRAELFSVDNEVHILAGTTIIQLIEFVAMSLLIFICVLAGLINYSIGMLKSCSVLMIHGYNKFTIIKTSSFKLLQLLLVSFVISYSLLVFYMSIAGYLVYFSTISFYFILMYGILFLIYMVATNIIMSIYLYTIKTISILKGKRPYFLLQFINHILKIGFIISILTFGSLAISNFIELKHRTQALSDWQIAQNIHATQVYFVGQSDLAIDFEIMNRKVGFYESMSRNNNAFVMDARPVYFLDLELPIHEDMSIAPQEKLDPNGYRITISPNYLDYNPIVATNGIPIKEQILYDDYVLNILVPENLKPYESEILRLYLDYFYFSKIRIDNIYNEDLGFELNNTTIEELMVNIIYVEYNQYYFSFNSEIRPQYGNRIKDPIAVMYTGSVNPSRLSASMSGRFFFHTDAIDAHNAILPLLVENELSHVIRSTISVFDQNSNSIVKLREHSIRMSAFIIILIISSITTIYALMSNYFEKNKYKIFVKLIMGYGFINRHLNFLLTILFYNVVIVAILSLFFGYIILLLGLILMVLDMLFIFVMDRKLTNKSFSKIIKGGV